MNVPVDIAHKVIDGMRGVPFLLAILILNLAVLAGFSVTLWSVSNAMERREVILARCLK